MFHKMLHIFPICFHKLYNQSRNDRHKKDWNGSPTLSTIVNSVWYHPVADGIAFCKELIDWLSEKHPKSCDLYGMSINWLSNKKQNGG